MFALVYYQKKRAEGGEQEVLSDLLSGLEGRERGLAPQHNLLNINDLKSSINTIFSFFHNDPNKTNTRLGHKGEQHGELTRPAASNCNWRFVADTKVNSYRHTFDISEATAESAWTVAFNYCKRRNLSRFSLLHAWRSLPADRFAEFFLHNSCFCHSFHHKLQPGRGERDGAKIFHR